VTITGPAAPDADGFTILVNNGVLTFLINDGDTLCTYREYSSTTGIATGNNFTLPDIPGTFCTGVDTADNDSKTHVLFFSRVFNKISTTTLTTSPSWSLSIIDTEPAGSAWSAVEDISLVHGFVGTPGAPNCHGKSVSDLAQRYGGMPNAASALGYASVADLQAGIDAFCND
jgi:hypothetical protein